MPLDLTGLDRRPDPTDAGPLKVTLVGVTRDGHPFRSGFWTTLFTLSEPPPLAFFSDFFAAMANAISSETIVTGGGYRIKAAPAYTDLTFATPGAGTIDPTEFGQKSNSATLGYGGKTVDATGATRNIRAISHIPCGYVLTAELGKEHRIVGGTGVAHFLAWFVDQAPCDSFGRPLEVYQYFALQTNAFYQKGRGQ